uniref:Decaprenyl diphosphate synthase subunit 1 n=1 Tax=Rousettus aegyptiacus TaxID=9407 RepID=A0A7J8E9J7_ROUAE|nr:decaprenyl diphosphate synthase subunit 1 [Rousettus aegyptiacus]
MSRSQWNALLEPHSSFFLQIEGLSIKEFPEMNAMIMRRFSLPGDVDRARQYVLQSDGVQQTTYLAQQYCHKAIREISKLRPSRERDALIQLSEIVLTRDK